MAERKLGVAIHGAGSVARAHVASWLKTPRAEIVSVSSRRLESAKNLAAEFQLDCAVTDDYQAVLRDKRVDVVNISGPNHVHAEHTIAAARAGKHVFCEKPMAVTLEDCDAMIKACRKAKVKLMIGQVCRYHAVHGKVRELARGGDFGAPICMTVHRLGGQWGGAYTQPWRLQRNLCGGTLLEINAHEIDFLRWVCGEVEAVYATGGFYVDRRLDYPDLALVTLHFASGAKGLLHAGQVSALGGYGGRVDCERGSIVFPAIWGADAGLHLCKTGEKATFLPASQIPVEDPVRHELRDFVDSVLNDTPPPVAGEDGRAAVEIGVAAYQSIECGETVPLPL